MAARTGGEKAPLLGNTSGYKVQTLPADTRRINEHEHFHAVVFKRRWWILFVFCLCALTQSLLWNTWSPILDAMLIAYDWKDSFIALLPALANGGYVIMAFPLMYIVETRGMIYVPLISQILCIDVIFIEYLLLDFSPGFL